MKDVLMCFVTEHFTMKLSDTPILPGLHYEEWKNLVGRRWGVLVLYPWKGSILKIVNVNEAWRSFSGEHEGGIRTVNQ